MKVRLRDVAERLGVSVSTVSMAMRGNPLVAEQTRARVAAALEEMGYVYNRAGAQLRTSRSLTVGVAINNLMNPFFAEVVASVERRLASAGRMTFLANTAESPERQRLFVRALAEHNADGLIVCPAEGSSASDFHGFVSGVPGARPMVLVSRTLDDFDCDHVINDDRLSGRLAARHLAGLGLGMEPGRGRGRIAWVGGGPATSTFRQRWAGFMEEMADAGMHREPEWIRAAASREAGAATAGSLLALDPRPDAVVCFGDLVALGLITGLRRHGLRVPDDISVIGFDGIGEGAMADPPLTSVSIDRQNIGTTAASYLLARLDRPERRRQTLVVPPRLVVGGTTREAGGESGHTPVKGRARPEPDALPTGEPADG